jgi:malate dehydrogenase (oxaloacetate-decarboxylating)(NADP+)
MAMLSYSNFGERNVGSPAMIHEAVAYLHQNNPEMLIDGEMQVNFALDKDLRHEKFPFSKIDGKNVNALIFPNLSSSSIAYKMMLEIGMCDTIGPIQMGLNKPIHILNVESSVRDVVNMVTIAVIDAQVEEQKRIQAEK